jgi:hypothetical protein
VSRGQNPNQLNANLCRRAERKLAQSRLAKTKSEQVKDRKMAQSMWKTFKLPETNRTLTTNALLSNKTRVVTKTSQTFHPTMQLELFQSHLCPKPQARARWLNDVNPRKKKRSHSKKLRRRRLFLFSQGKSTMLTTFSVIKEQRESKDEKLPTWVQVQQVLDFLDVTFKFEAIFDGLQSTYLWLSGLEMVFFLFNIVFFVLNPAN